MHWWVTMGTTLGGWGLGRVGEGWPCVTAPFVFVPKRPHFTVHRMSATTQASSDGLFWADQSRRFCSGLRIPQIDQ